MQCGGGSQASGAIEQDDLADLSSPRDPETVEKAKDLSGDKHYLLAAPATCCRHYKHFHKGHGHIFSL